MFLINMKKVIAVVCVLTLISTVVYWGNTVMYAAVNDLIIDNTDSACSSQGSWTTSTWDSGYYGSGYQHDGSSTADADKWVKWTPAITTDGLYEVYMRWTESDNRPDAAPIVIQYDGGIDTSKTINQQIDGGTWKLIGEYIFSEGADQYVQILASDEGYTIADAVKFVHKTVTEDRIIDNGDNGYSVTGDWSESGLLGYNDSSSYYTSTAGNKATWETVAPETSSYEIHIWYPHHENSANNVRYTITTGDGVWTKDIDQRLHGDGWYNIVTVSAEENTTITVKLTVSNANTRADAVMFRKTSEEPDPIEDEDADGKILVNQSGYDLNRPKRFTIYGVADGTPYEIKKGVNTVYTGVMDGQIGDFSDFNPTDSGEYHITCNNKTSVNFSIGAYWMQKVSIDPALQFMIQSRADSFLWGSNGIGWRDSHQFSFELNTLVNQYMANPSAYERMAYTVNASECEYPELQVQQEPDIIWLIKFAAKRYLDINQVDNKPLHELVKGGLPYFLAIYPDIQEWVSQEFYEEIRDMTIEEWDNPGHGDTWYGISGHDSNLYKTKTVTGTAKGNYPPGHSIVPNLLMYDVIERDGLEGAQAYLDAAYNNCKWVIDNVDWHDPKTTKGQRMSEHITMEALAYYQEKYPELAPPGLMDKINQWVDIVINRSDNIWDFRKYDDPGDGYGVGDRWTVPDFNEPGNVAGFMAPAYGAMRVISDDNKKVRLEEIAVAQIDNVFGRNPFGRHFSHDAPSAIQGVEMGWIREYEHAGAGVLGDVTGVLDGAPKEATYPYNPQASEGYTEGWVAFNTAWNASLAYSAAQDTEITIMDANYINQMTTASSGQTIGIVLTAPLNFDYDIIETGHVIMSDSNGNETKIEVTEENSDSLSLRSTLIVPSDIGWLEISYGYGLFKEVVRITVNE